jgi:hypothetical protein
MGTAKLPKEVPGRTKSHDWFEMRNLAETVVIRLDQPMRNFRTLCPEVIADPSGMEGVRGDLDRVERLKKTSSIGYVLPGGPTLPLEYVRAAVTARPCVPEKNLRFCFVVADRSPR